jgi:hypothetical protein
MTTAAIPNTTSLGSRNWSNPPGLTTKGSAARSSADRSVINTSAFVDALALALALGRCFAFDPVDFKERVYTPSYALKNKC